MGRRGGIFESQEKMKTGFLTIDWTWEDGTAIYRSIQVCTEIGPVAGVVHEFNSGDVWKDYFMASVKIGELLASGEIAHCSASSSADEFVSASEGKYGWAAICKKGEKPALEVSGEIDYEAMPYNAQEVIVPGDFINLNSQKMTPADKKRCQAEITPAYNAFTIGDVRKAVRCENKPVVIITEKEPGADGQKGSMSLCKECLKEAEKQLPELFTIEPIQIHTEDPREYISDLQNLIETGWFEPREGEDRDINQHMRYHRGLDLRSVVLCSIGHINNLLLQLEMAREQASILFRGASSKGK